MRGQAFQGGDALVPFGEALRLVLDALERIGTRNELARVTLLDYGLQQ
jgi:hypothetical protein